MTGSSHMAPLSSLQLLAFELAFRSPVLSDKLEPWITDYTTEKVRLSRRYLDIEPLPVLCSKCGYRLGTMEGGWFKAGECRHCPDRSHVKFDAMLQMLYALIGPSISDKVVLDYLDKRPLDASIVRVVEKKASPIYQQAPVKPTHKLINLDDGTLDAILAD